ncbi:prolyl oligopeptidase family serine peptidase [Silvibacterium acidisoli]|uniref:prolyl oligopeptidase family serine peptidase n=1 Tax=Acidobacteriaceae bacterium ZG23-2 TaxID=2883246 RepID=UPI00406C1787
MKHIRSTLLLFPFLLSAAALHAQTKPAITLDEFLNTTEVRDAKISADGSMAVIATSQPDWQQDRFAGNLWFWSKATGKLLPLTQSGHDSSPEISPDGRYVAFLSDRAIAGAESSDEKSGDKDDDDAPSRIWIIPVGGGEAFPLYREKLDTHAFAWSKDSNSIDFAVTQPLSKNEEDARKEQWKDTIRWREQERGDVLLERPVSMAYAEATTNPAAHAEAKPADDKPALPAGSQVLTHLSLAISEVAPSPDGQQIALMSGPIWHRLENPADTEIFLLSAHGGEAHQLTHNQGLEGSLTWSPDNAMIYFSVRAGAGAIEGDYQDLQGRIYSIDPQSGKTTRYGADFTGSWDDITVTSDGKLLATGLLGTGEKLYRVEGAHFKAIGSVAGSYAHIEAAHHGDALIYMHSAIGVPTQVYVSESASGIDATKPVTNFNPIFAERAQVEWQPYKWKSFDGTEVEGVLIYPPGRKGAKNLHMFTLIHGGPEDADGDRFGADWYDWATYAASQGWLVFRPNYRGSTGYGDKFMLEIVPHIVSVPGKDILTGVDALVKDGIADPDHLTVGGYSYGGYMTNWLITQTTRFKAATTGAGAVEHAANWGFDDLTYDDAWFLSGTPWEKPEIYQSEAALFQMNKVTTPTHIVAGNADNRVSYFEQVVLDRALQRLNVPHTLLLFPGENHPLSKNPWHGYIKVREELKWLDTYGNK